MAKAADAANVSLGLRFVSAGLLCLLLVLQARLWLSDDGWPEVLRLRTGVVEQQTTNEHLAVRNARLQAEVADLKSGFAALEERARSDLGMVGEDESFYLIVPPDENQAVPATVD
jgi:cell division protein FtsB